jgi:DNA-binding NarL/FixJ family response regulator
MINIVVVDDHPVVRAGLVAMLSTEPDFKVVAEAESGAEAITLINHHRPDVTVVDLQLPDMDGASIIKKIRSDWPEARFLVLTSFDADDRIFQAVRAGAQGYLLKGVPKEGLFLAVRTIHQGSSLFGPGIAPKLLQAGGTDEFSGPASVNRLSHRELEILQLIADGCRNKEIAANLFISERTVKFHVNTIFQKLGASSRTESVKLAAQRGLVHI